MIGELIQRIEDLERRLGNTIRVGRVSRADAATGRIQVIFDDPGDGGEVTTHTLPVLYPRTRTQRDQWTHRPGESVVCVMIPVGQEDGFAIGAYYDGANPPPSGDAADRIIHGDRVRVRGDSRVVVDSGDVRLGGADATEAVVLGDTWSSWVTSTLLTHTHPTPAGPSSPSAELAASPPTGHLSGIVRVK